MNKKIINVHKHRINWEAIIGIGAIIGTTITLHIDTGNKIQEQVKRTDRLYEMFIDLIKETRK